MGDIIKAIENNNIINGNTVVRIPNDIFSFSSANILAENIENIDLYTNRFNDNSYYFSSLSCAHTHAGVIMTGWESGTRCLDASGVGCGGSPIGFSSPYQTYVYGDESVVFENGVWKYKNMSTVLAESNNGPHYPWEANWSAPFFAYKWCIANQASEYE